MELQDFISYAILYLFSYFCVSCNPHLQLQLFYELSNMVQSILFSPILWYDKKICSFSPYAIEYSFYALSGHNKGHLYNKLKKQTEFLP